MKSHFLSRISLIRKIVQELSQAGAKIDPGEIKAGYGLSQRLDLVFFGGC